jgi:hypothetical protein
MEKVDMRIDEGNENTKMIGWAIGEVARVSATNTLTVSRDTSATSTSLTMNEAMKLGIDVTICPSQMLLLSHR